MAFLTLFNSCSRFLLFYETASLLLILLSNQNNFSTQNSRRITSVYPFAMWQIKFMMNKLTYDESLFHFFLFNYIFLSFFLENLSFSFLFITEKRVITDRRTRFLLLDEAIFPSLELNNATSLLCDVIPWLYNRSTMKMIIALFK